MLPISVKKQLTDKEMGDFALIALSVFQNTGIPEKESEDLLAKLTGHYSEPHRAYHNLSHLMSLFRVAEASGQPIKNPNVFSLCILFHDIIYEIGNKDNEAKSAAMAAELVGPFLGREKTSLLVEMIESTAKHEPLSDEADTLLFLDCDLAILATSPEVYRDYAKAIRSEYGRYPNLFYRHGRKQVLRHFLEKERIFFTGFFHENHEVQARANLRSELQSLTSLFS